MLFVIITLLILCLIYICATRNQNYWAKRGVKHDPPLPVFGNHLPNILGKRSSAGISVELYQRYNNEKIVGYYRGCQPELIIRDPQIIKHILNLDFKYFSSRGHDGNPQKETLMKNLFFMDGDEWRLLRRCIPAAFTASKLRTVFPHIASCTNNLYNGVDAIISDGGDIKTNEFISPYILEIVMSCVFGVDISHLTTNERKACLQKTQSFFQRSKWQRVCYIFEELLPELKCLLGSYIITKDLEKMVLDLTKSVREMRNNQPSGRNDFMDIILEIERQERVSIDSLYKKNPDGSPEKVELEMNDDFTAAQVFAFLVGGVETSTTSISFTLHELAHHPDIQLKVQKEIDTVLSKYDNKICYDAISEMTFLDLTLKESLRIFSFSGNLKRICTKRYTIPGTDVTIDPGIKMSIPVHALHHDPKYYNDPDEFRPERFSADEIKKRPSSVYLPFGEGPRKCVANRLGAIQVLSVLVAILQRYTVEPPPSSQRQLKCIHTSYLVQSIEGGLPLRIKRRQ